MNTSYLKNKNIHFLECENWLDTYGYEKSEMKEDTINYIEQLEQQYKKQKEGINKAIEYVQNHQLVFKDATLEEIEEWFNKFYIDVLDILKEVSE